MKILIDTDDYKPFDGIHKPHHHKDGYLDGGTIIQNGIVIGHIDPRGEKGAEGISGHPDPIGIEITYELLITVHHNAVVNTIKACIDHWGIDIRNRSWPVMPEIDYKCKK